MGSKILLYGIQCSFESMLALMALTSLYLQRHGPIVVYFSLFYCIASRQLSPSSGRVAALEFLPRDLVEETYFVLIMSIYETKVL